MDSYFSIQHFPGLKKGFQHCFREVSGLELRFEHLFLDRKQVFRGFTLSLSSGLLSWVVFGPFNRFKVFLQFFALFLEEHTPFSLFSAK